MLIRAQESLSQLDTTIVHLEGKKNVIADALSRIYNPIKMTPTRDSFSPPDNSHGFTAQLPVIINYLTSTTHYLHIPLPTITSYTTMPTHANNRITAGNSNRRYVADDREYFEFLDINLQEVVRTRPLTSQLQHATKANRPPLATFSAAAVNNLKQAATSVAVASNATTTRAQAQQHRLVIEEPKPRKLLRSIVINNQPSLLNRPPTLRPNHIHLNELGAGETSADRFAPFAGPSQHRHTTSLMWELSAEDDSTEEDRERGEGDGGMGKRRSITYEH